MSLPPDTTSESRPARSAEQLETLVGVVIAVFAAILAINGLGAGKFGDDEQNAIIEKSNQFAWYQSKSVKKGMTEGQADFLQVLRDTGVIAADKSAVVAAEIEALQQRAARYEREAQVILSGSAAVRDQPWFPGLDADMQDVVGAYEQGKKVEDLGRAGDYFDLGELFLQLCVVLGAICLVVKRPRLKHQFFAGMVVLGLIGTAASLWAFHLAAPHF